jgi:hypothetical protein
MKKFIFLLAMLVSIGITQTQAQFLKQLKSVVEQSITTDSTTTAVATDTTDVSATTTDSTVDYTEEEANSGIKEALISGVTKGVAMVSKENGYFGDELIKISFPEEVQTIEKKLRAVGMGNLVDKAVLSMNRAAEDAAPTAKDIFVGAIKELTITDATNLVLGSDTAATHYLKEHTTAKLTAEFSPIINNSLETVNATKYWDDVINSYNQLPLVRKMNPDLGAYVTEKAIEGLFIKIADQEKAIRENPLEQTSSLLKKIFN